MVSIFIGCFAKNTPWWFQTLRRKTSLQISAVLMHSWKRDQMKNFHFFGIVDFQRFWYITLSLWSMSWITFFMQAMEKFPFVLNLQIWESLPQVSTLVLREIFISFQSCSSTFLIGLLGNKSHSRLSVFHKSLIEFHFLVARAYSLGLCVGKEDCVHAKDCQKKRDSPLLIFHLIWGINHSTPLMIDLQGALRLLNLPLVGISPK